MATRTLNLPDQLDEFVRRSVEAGRYHNENEVISAALRLLEQYEAEDAARLEALRQIVGRSFEELDRGEYTEYGRENLAEFFERLNDDVRARLRQA